MGPQGKPGVSNTRVDGPPLADGRRSGTTIETAEEIRDDGMIEWHHLARDGQHCTAAELRGSALRAAVNAPIQCDLTALTICLTGRQGVRTHQGNRIETLTRKKLRGSTSEH